VVALVLGYPTEEALRQSLIMSDGSPLIFFTRPLSSPIMIAALVLFLLPAFQMLRRRLRARAEREAPGE
jgi:putative tricarboxylic transport membrane protein